MNEDIASTAKTCYIEVNDPVALTDFSQATTWPATFVQRFLLLTLSSFEM